MSVTTHVHPVLVKLQLTPEIIRKYVVHVEPPLPEGWINNNVARKVRRHGLKRSDYYANRTNHE